MSLHVLILLEALPFPLDPRVRAQSAALRAAGHEVTVVSPTASPGDPVDEVLDGVQVRRFPAPPAGGGVLGYGREYAIAGLRVRTMVRDVLRERRVDVVVTCGPPDLLVTPRAAGRAPWRCRRVRLPRGLPRAVRGEVRPPRPPYWALRIAERHAFHAADAVTAVSEPCAELARARGGVDPSRVFLVGNGADPERVHPVAPRPELRRGREHLVLWLGMMSSQDNLDRLVEAAGHVVHSRGRTDVQFALVGPGDARERLQRDVDERRLGAFVELPGCVDDELVRAYISTADVCVGVDEPNAMNDRAAMRKIFEYMAVGKAVVQFPLREMQRLCGDACAYARPGDAADLAATICGLLDDPERRRELGAAGRRRALNGLMWPAQVPALLAAVGTATEAVGATRREET